MVPKNLLNYAIWGYHSNALPSVNTLHKHKLYCRPRRASRHLFQCIVTIRSRESSVGTSTGYRLDGPGSIPSMGKIFLYYSVQTGSGAHPASYPMRLGGDFSRVKWPRSEVDRAEAKNGGAIPPLPHMSSWHNI
jgi:hypothetical protein